MALVTIVSGSATSTTVSSGETPIYYHGTHEEAACQIVASGLNWDELSKVKGAHAFWLTTKIKVALQYANINPVNRASPALVKLEGLSDDMLMDFLSQEPPWVLRSIEVMELGLLPQTFDRINATVTFSMLSLTELGTITFDEQT